jgi:anti-sigma B factor antagonist
LKELTMPDFSFPPPTFSVHSERLANGVVRVCLAGEVDLATYEVAVVEFLRAARERPRTLAVDLSAVEFMDSSGGLLLVEARRMAESAGASLVVVVNGSAPARRVLELLGLDEYLDVVDDRGGRPDGARRVAAQESGEVHIVQDNQA